MQDYFEFSDSDSVSTLASGSTMQTKRKQKALYYKAPIFIRPFILFIWRYIFKLGFLDGAPGFIYHFMLNFWYRELVDAKIYEHKMLNTEFEKPVRYDNFDIRFYEKDISNRGLWFHWN